MPRDPSRTAIGVAAMRAAHQRLDGTPRILEDPIAERLLDDRTRAWLEQAADPAVLDAGASLRAHVVTRSRFAEDRFEQAVARGVRQYVMLGAGFDTFSYRQPDWARDSNLFEVDEPGTQHEKRARLAAAGIDPPANLTYVAADFESESAAEALIRAGFNRAAPAFISWLGVTMYLNAAANDAVFEFAASLPASSELVFTFAPALSDSPSPRETRLEGLATAVGEPWRTRYDPRALAGKLRGLGFASVWLPSPAEIAAAYFLHRSEDLPLPWRRTIVSAVV
jgi:methyltransferase (TIGR00027 family)